MSAQPPTLHIDPIGGVITASLKNGRIYIAGCKDKWGYIVIRTKGINRFAHQLVWESVNGRVPMGLEIDHINGDPADNRLINLRLVTHSQNMQNTHKVSRKNKTSGVKGVHWDKNRGQWRSHITLNGKQKFIGRFDSIADAKEAYNRAAFLVHDCNPHAIGN